MLNVSDVREQVPRPHVEMYERPPTPRAVTPSDVTNTKHTIDALHFQMETIVRTFQNVSSLRPFHIERKRMRTFL